MTNHWLQTNKQITTWCESISNYETTWETQYMWQLKFSTTVPTVPCMSNDLTCGYIAGVYFCLYTKEMLRYKSCEICYNPSEFYGYYVCHWNVLPCRMFTETINETRNLPHLYIIAEKWLTYNYSSCYLWMYCQASEVTVCVNSIW